MDEAKYSDQIIKIPAGLTADKSSLGFSVLATCSDWCAEQCGSSAEIGGCSDCKTSCEFGCQRGQSGQCDTAEGCTSGQCSSCQSRCQGCQDACESSTQQPSGASLEFGAVTSTSIEVRIKGLDTTSWGNYGTSKVPRYNSFKISCIGDVRTVARGSTSGRTAYLKFTGLTPATTYEFAYIVSFTSNTGVTNEFTGGYDTQDTSVKARPHYFTWLRGSVTSKPSVNELSWGDDIPPYLTADGWNTYTASINAVREYRGLGQYSFTAAVAGRTELSAAMVNQAIKAINDMSPPILPPSQTSSMKTPGSAALLNKLVDSLNSIT